MKNTTSPLDLSKILWPLRATWAGLIAERLAQAFWPFWTVILIALAAVFFEIHATLGRETLLALGGLLAVGLGVTAVLGIRRFAMPGRDEALERLDRSMPGRPISATLDSQAIGAGDEASRSVWDVHVARMQARLGEAQAVKGDLRVSDRDRYGIRYVALTLFVVAVAFGSLLRGGNLSDSLAGTGAEATTAGPSWEIWIEPPGYTGKPTLYLNDIDQAALEVPKDSQLTVRLYGTPGDVALSETVSGTTSTQTPATTEEPQTAFSLPIVQSGTVSVGGDEGQSWTITTLGDALPEVAYTGEIDRSPEGEMRLSFEARDDYGVYSGTAQIELNLAAVDRRYGLTPEPEAREVIILDLPMPISGNRTEFTELLIENLSLHPWAGLPVTMTLEVRDGSEQQSAPEIIEVPLPGRRFFQPIAKAVIEQRRDLLWSMDNITRIDQVLRTITHRPDGFISNERAYLTLRRVLTRMELARNVGGLNEESREEIADMLWRAALLLEEGSLADARERLRRAQERLSDAMREGATDEEIAELMQELSEAMDQYMQQLAQQQQQEGGEQQQAQGESMEITGDQLQQMLDEIQRMMEEGDMEGAERLLSQLMEMMQNMQIAQGQQGQGQQSPGQQAMEGLQDTLRDQQGLSDEAFRDLQEQLNPDAQAGENQGNEGQNGGQGRGEQHEGQGGQGQAQNNGEQQGQGQQQGQQQGQGGDQGSLADRQEALRNQLNRQSQNLPGAGTPEGDAARDALRRADEAMDRAEDALRDDRTADALGAQSDAMDALRDGLRNLGEAMAQQQQQQQDGGQQGQANGDPGQQNRDPLGREPGSEGVVGSPDNLLGGEAARRRSRDLLDEIRRRSGEKERPQVERDYLERLLDQF